MAEPIFEIVEFPDFHPTELGFDNGGNVTENYGRSLYLIYSGEFELGFFPKGSLEWKFFDSDSPGFFNINDSKGDTEKERRIAQEMEELNKEPDNDYGYRRGADKAYRERELAKKANQRSRKKIGKIKNPYRKIARNLGRYL